MNRSKKVGYLVPEFPQQTHIFFWREVQALKALGLDIMFISTRKPDISAVKHAFAPEAAKQTFYLHPPNFIWVFYLLAMPLWTAQALQYVRSLDSGGGKKVKVLYFTVLAAGLIRYCQKRGISHIHGHSCADVAHILALAGLHDSLSYSLTLHGSLSTYGADHRQKMRQASFVSAVTNPLQQEITERVGLASSQVPVISMGVDLAKFTGAPRVIEDKRPLKFISVARLSIGKGHRFSLRALRRLMDMGIEFTYLIVGGGPDRKSIEAEISELGLQDRVTLAGTLGEDEVLQALLSADVLLLTSSGVFEAAPVCLMEAMASGMPAIVSIIGGTRDMVVHEVNGFLVEQENIDQIEAAMLKFVNNPDLVTDMGVAARQFAELNFDYRFQAKKLHDFIVQSH